MVDAVEFLFLGVVLGLVQGLSPGPLVTLVISETLKFGKREGFKVAVSPLVTDSTVAVLSLLVLSNLAKSSMIIGVISILGACYLTYLAWENLRVKTGSFETMLVKKGALKRAVITNFLNPHVYIFWLSVGAPTILNGLGTHVSLAVLFLLGFYLFLIGSETCIAYLVSRSKAFIEGKYYSYIIRVLGLVLIFFALLLLIEGYRLLTLL